MSEEEITRGVHGDAIIAWEDGTTRTYAPVAVENLGERFKGGYFRPLMTREEEFDLLFTSTHAFYLILCSEEDKKPNLFNVHPAYKRLLSLYPYFSSDDVAKIDARMDDVDPEWRPKIAAAMQALGFTLKEPIQ